MTDRVENLIRREESTDLGAQEMAAARLTNEAVRGLNRALAASGLSGKELSQKLDVTQGRISKVINGTGNIRLSTFARVLRAMGYRARLVIEPATPDVAPLPEPNRSKLRPRHQKTYVNIFKVPVLGEFGVGEGLLVTQGPVEHADVVLGDPKHSVTRTIVKTIVKSEVKPSPEKLAITP